MPYFPNRSESAAPVAAENSTAAGLEDAFSFMSLPPVQELQSDDQKRLLDSIDSLREQGLDATLALPQLVVCGDQSTGKSSVLEAISRIPFPRGESLCTRFASEIVLRREPEQSIEVSIRPGPGRNETEVKRLKAFSRRLESFDEFPSVIEEAKRLMGLDGHSGQGKSGFSSDTLHVQCRGPMQQDLTLVDLPGIIHATGDNQSLDDPRMVNELIENYISQPNSIILAVITATTDWENQEIVQRAKRLDPEGKRTLGIITKIDRVRKGSADEKKLVLLAKNKLRLLDLGWYVLKNVDTAAQIQPVSHQERDAQEMAFFQSSPFQDDPVTKLGVGIAALHKNLRYALLDKIRSYLPTLLNTIETNIQERQREHKTLGNGRPTLQDQRNFLMGISQEYYKLCHDAIQGNYQNDAGLTSRDGAEHLKLCAVLRGLHDGFADEIYENGARWVQVGKIAGVTSKSLDECSSMCPLTGDEIVDMACEIVEKNRGPELPGETNPHVIRELFISYSEPWQDIAKSHVLEVGGAINSFVLELLGQLTDESTVSNIHAFWLAEQLNLNADEGINELEKLSAANQHYPMTWNRRWSQQREKVQKLVEDFGATEEEESRVSAFKALKTMERYAQVAREIFVDNVPHLAIWSPMVNSLPDAFSPKRVMAMDDALVEELAAEPEHIIARRAQLVDDLDRFMRGRDEFKRQILAQKSGRSSSCRTRPTTRVKPLRVATPAPALSASASLLRAQTPPPAFSASASPASTRYPSSARSAASVNTAITTPSPSPSPSAKIYSQPEVPQFAVTQHLSPKQSTPRSHGFGFGYHADGSPKASPSRVQFDEVRTAAVEDSDGEI